MAQRRVLGLFHVRGLPMASTLHEARTAGAVFGTAAPSPRVISTRVSLRSSPPRTVSVSGPQVTMAPTAGTRPAVAVTKPPRVS